MRMLRRNKQKVYYALYEGKEKIYDSYGDETGESIPQYSDPVCIRANISASRGDVYAEPFGINLNYQRTMIVNGKDCPIKEDTVLWIGIEPTENHNYVVIQVAKSLNHTMYALKEVSST